MEILMNHKRTILLAMVDTIAIVFSCLLSYFAITFFSEFENEVLVINLNVQKTMIQSALLAVCNLVGMGTCGVYRNIWRYASVKDFVKLVFGVMLGTILYYIFNFAFSVSGSDIFAVMSIMLTLISVVVLRMGYYYIYNRLTRGPAASRTRTLIVGGGEACHRILEEMKKPESKYRPIAIVDDDPVKQRRKINDILVSGRISDIPEIVEQMRIKTILMAIPSCSSEEKERILNICSETMCEVKTIPFLHDLMMNADLLGQAQSINVEDLLGRDVINFDDFEVNQLVKDKVCMVTGGGGSIGSELCRQIAKYSPKKLIIVDIYENNAYDIQQELLANYTDIDLDVRIASVRDYDKMKALFEMFKPELVYHAAAHKHVPLMETSPEEAIKNNVAGTYNVASLANLFGVRKFVLVSTDKAVNPTNVMGATKRCCEMIVQYFAQKSTFTEFVAVRFGNVLGSNGSVIPLFEKQIASGGPITVTHPDIIRYFMTIPEAVSLILQAGTIARGGEIFVLDMGEPVKILSLAENLIKLHGKEPYKDIDIQFTGLRPGEKLFEELLMSEEGLRETANKKIFIGKQIEIEEESFVESIERINGIAKANNSGAVVEELRKLVTTFNLVVVNKSPGAGQFLLIV